MNKVIKKKWLNALRSGKFEQAQLCLSDGAGYCCLGVLCKITGNAKNRNMGRYYPITTDTALMSPLPFLGLDSKQQKTLAGMNDQNKTFEQIADYIQKNVKATSSKK